MQDKSINPQAIVLAKGLVFKIVQRYTLTREVCVVY